jgi:poly(A)-specific ribonuclease
MLDPTLRVGCFSSVLHSKNGDAFVVLCFLCVCVHAAHAYILFFENCFFFHFHTFFCHANSHCLSLGYSHLIQALDKSKYRDGLRAVRRYIPKLEQQLEILRAQLESTAESNTEATEGIQISDKVSIEPSSISNFQLDKSDKLRAMINDNKGCSEDDADIDFDLESYSDKLSDIFETDSDTENLVNEEKPLYLNEFNKFPEQSDGDTDDFEEHLQQISFNSKNMEKDTDLPKFDEVDHIFLRAASFLKKKRK